MVSSSSASSDASYAGGLVGYFSGSGGIKDSYASGSVSSSSYYYSAGGLVGYFSGSGGIEDSYASGSVSSSSSSYSSSYAGGLVGHFSGSGGIEDSYASGSVSSSSAAVAAAGGLVGFFNGSREIKDSYASGSVSSFCSSSPSSFPVFPANAGGLVGDFRIGAEIKDSYWNKEAKILSKANGNPGTITEKGTPLSTEQMTGTGTGRADKTMKLNPSIWTFTKDGPVYGKKGAMQYQTLYYPRLSGITYLKGTEPKQEVERGYALRDCIEVAITGTIAEGKTLTAVVADKKGAPDTVKGTEEYQWYVDGKAVPGAVFNTYRIEKGKANKPVKVVVAAPSFWGQVEAYAVKVSKVSLSNKSMVLYKGKTRGLKAVVSPSNAVNRSLAWTSSNPKIASVDSKGRVTAKDYGRVSIRAAAKDGSKKSAVCVVTVPYRIKYVLNKGKNHKSNPSAYWGRKVTFKKPSRKGYQFVGWYRDKKLKKKISKISKGTKKDYKIYAKWKKIKVGSTWMYNLRNKKSRTVTFQWKNVPGARGYQVQYASNKKMKKAEKTTRKGRSAKIKKLKAGKRYYIRVRAYKTDSAGKRVYGTYSPKMRWRVW